MLLLSRVRVWCRLSSGHELRKFGSVKRGWVHIVHDWVTVRMPFCQSNLREKEEFWQLKQQTHGCVLGPFSPQVVWEEKDTSSFGKDWLLLRWGHPE